jgi:hypothetical protein
MVECKCSDFILSWNQIINAQLLANLHGMCYTGEVIRFCPWCGKELEEMRMCFSPYIEMIDINNNEQLNLFKEEEND